MNDYSELRCRSAFSFLSGASLPETLIEQAANLGHEILACGDRDGLYAAPRLHRAARDTGIRVIHGCHLTMVREGEGGRPWVLYVLVENRQGYRNLCRLLTRTRLRAAKGAAAVCWSDFTGGGEGLICLAGGRNGPLAATLPAGETAVRDCVRRLRQVFGNRLYVDLQRHFDPGEERTCRALFDIARRFQVPITASNDVRYASVGEKPLLDVLTCIRAKMTLDMAGRRLPVNAERCLKPPRDMAELFRDLPEAVVNTQRIAERCEFQLDDIDYRFPEYPLPPDETPMQRLRELSWMGARERYGTPGARVRRQIEHELAIIDQLGMAGYFLVVWDIVRYCREQGILAQGRGSAANSVVCYSLGITAVDPIGMDLLFERFLSLERGQWPDIDIDLPGGPQREKVIRYVYRRHGKHGAAMTANVITYRTRSAVREVGKVLGLPADRLDRLARLLHRFEFRDDQDDLPRQLAAGGVDARAPRVTLLVDLVRRIRHLPRHLGQHSGGMVIAAGRLDDVVPLEPARMPGRVVVQWDKDDCADLGIIKVDLLGLRMLAVLEEAIPLVHEHEGVRIDLAHLPPDDPLVYRMLRAADSVGVFQVESRAQMATLPRLQPKCFYDLVVQVAIIRPGPIVGEMVHPYLERRNGRAPITYAHPVLEPILARTLGVPLFQEQILRMAMAAAGFSGGEAEELRRAMGFKQSHSRMDRFEQRLRAGMAQRGITGEAAEEIAHGITSFALYGFPESHAASFALISYASAYLRAHHPAAYTCAMLNQWPLGFYHPSTLLEDARRHGLRVRPVDVTCSFERCTLERMPVAQGGASGILSVRLGLRYVKGLRRQAAERLVVARRQRPFTGVADVAARASLREDERESLAHVGAFAAFGRTRRTALWQTAGLPARGTLFEHAEAKARASESMPLPEMSPVERTLADYSGTGVTIGPHLLHHLRGDLSRQRVLRARDLDRLPSRSWVKVAGLVIVRQRPGTAKGTCFLTLEDETGLANVVVDPELFRRRRALLHDARLLVVEGPLQNIDGVRHVRARRFQRLSLPSY